MDTTTPGGLKPDRPARQGAFGWAIAQAPARSRFEVAGAGLEVLQWGARDAPGLLLMHGSGAQADWWSFIAPHFAATRHVVAFSFSGMGRSDWRESYSIAGMVREAMAVAREAGLFGAKAPVFVAHSLAGLPLAHIVADHGAHLAGAVMIDTLLRPPPKPISGRAQGPAPQHRRYPTRDAALASYRLLPGQAKPNDEAVAFIAGHAVVEVKSEDGTRAWTWRHDPTFAAKLAPGDEETLVGRAACPMAVVTGEASPLLTAATTAEMLERMRPGSISVVVPEAAHHVFVDQPIATIAILRTLLATWSKGAGG